MRTATRAIELESKEYAWPAPPESRVVFLLDVASRLERRLLEEWIEGSRPETITPGAVEAIAIPSSRRTRRRRSLDPRLEAALAVGDNPVLAPLRVAWLRKKQDGVHNARLRGLLTFGDPRDPNSLRQWWVRRRDPGRCRVVAGEPAPLSELRARWRRLGGPEAAETIGLADFVARQAALALERAERKLRGARYKVPRFVREEILARPAFRGGVARLARELGRKERKVLREADRYLGEIAARHGTHEIDLAAHLCRFLYTRGYSEELSYDRDELQRIYALGQRYPLVFMPSHKSNLDHIVLQYLLYLNEFPPNHTAGGINMNILGLGALFHRAGVFFIRRDFRGNPVYRFVLRQYIDYLIEKRFSLEWYIEGGRSRSGKLLPPRFGLLAYVVDAYRRGKSEDVILVPVSIAYDQIQEIRDYVAEHRGGAKERESLTWFFKFVRALRRGSGTIHIRFGEPLSLRKFFGPPDPEIEDETDPRDLDLQKLAFEVCVRINRATPIIPCSLLGLALLGAGDRALSLDEMPRMLQYLLEYVRRRQLPTTEGFNLDAPDGIECALECLQRGGVVSRFAEGPEPVYMIGSEQQLAAAYYRNTIVHFFVNGAIAELALLAASEADAEDQLAEFWEESLRLRDLLKFEFFFPPRDAFCQEIRGEIALHDPAWEDRVRKGPEEIVELVRNFHPFSAHRVLRPFLEAYRVVGDMLEREDPASQLDEEPFLRRCLGLGQQYYLQRRIRSLESVSKVLFQMAVQLARNRELVDPGPADLLERRQAFAEEIRQVIRRIEAVDALAASRRAGLID